MIKNEIKTGDIVRYIGDDNDLGYDLPLCNGADYVVAKVNDSEVDLETPYIFPGVDIKDLELIEPLDRKTAFLTELQALLRKYDAKIESCAEGTEDSWIDIYFGDECVICFDRNPQTCCATITADNIMDFDKE